MKLKYTLSLSIVITLVIGVYAEQPAINARIFEKCGTVIHQNFLEAKNPDLKQQFITDENKLQQAISNLANFRSPSAIYTIPVVVHVVWYTSGQNISDAQVQSQIDVLNEDFARRNADTTNTPVPFRSVASATNFQFVLAARDPNGNATNGIERRQTTVQTFPPNDDVKFNSSGGMDAWNVNKYLNIWVCDLGGFILGYGELPATVHTNTYGVVLHYNAFGKTGVVAPPYDLGRTCTHEISHCFRLYHIWGDEDQCSGTDYVNDTPNQAKATYGCLNFPHTDICSALNPGIMFMNYMDYSDDNCLNMFTANQATRMFAAINTYYNSLLTSDGGQSPNAIPEIFSDFQFSLYPNPASGIINLDMFTTKFIGTSVNVKVTDVLGKTVHQSVILNPNGYIHQVNLEKLSNGVYFLTLYNDNYKKTERITINK